jgi:hypothetical protein
MRINLDISPDHIANLMCSAIEGGDPVTTAKRGGWCDGIYYRTKDTPETELPDKGLWYVDHPYFYESPDFQIEVIEVDDERTGHTKSHIIRRDQLVAGLRVMATKFPSFFAQILADDADAPCADIFLQCVVFGEEKYA